MDTNNSAATQTLMTIERTVKTNRQFGTGFVMYGEVNGKWFERRYPTPEAAAKYASKRGYATKQVERVNGIVLEVQSTPSACYTHEDGGLEDASVCPACLLEYVEAIFGAQAPTALHLKRHLRG